MRKSNFIKGIVCGLMLTAVVGSTVFAGTYTEEVYGYKNANMRKTYTGSVGVYTATGTDELARIVAVNNTNSTRFYKVEFGEKHTELNQYVEYIADSDVVATYSSIQVTGSRTYDDVYYAYSLIACGYNSTAEATGLADYFNYYIKQRND